MANAPLSFGHSECSRVKQFYKMVQKRYRYFFPPFWSLSSPSHPPTPQVCQNTMYRQTYILVHSIPVLEIELYSQWYTMFSNGLTWFELIHLFRKIVCGLCLMLSQNVVKKMKRECNLCYEQLQIFLQKIIRRSDFDKGEKKRSFKFILNKNFFYWPLISTYAKCLT